MLKRMTGQDQKCESTPLWVWACRRQAGSPTEGHWLTHSSSLSPGGGTEAQTCRGGAGPWEEQGLHGCQAKSTPTRERQAAQKLPRTSHRERGCVHHWEEAVLRRPHTWAPGGAAREDQSRTRAQKTPGLRTTCLASNTLAAKGGVRTVRRLPLWRERTADG